MSATAVRAEERDACLWVTLDRPPLNVLDVPTIRALEAALHPLGARRDLKALILRSGIDGTFSAGADIRDHTPDRAGAMLEAFHELFLTVDGLPQVTIAAVDGRCLGGGCELAAFCDILLATPRSTFGQPEIDVGCFPPVAAAFLPRVVGRAAFEMVLTGAIIPAAEAERIGLVTRVAEAVEADAAALAARLATRSGAVLALARKALRAGCHGAFDETLARMERIYREELLLTDDAIEGVRAFLEKRPPHWSDR
jgi:cyclohexa-1,5-dienecarbonyl-CoA hydratase